MEFWGVEVKAGQKLKVHPGSATILHLSQASLGEAKKGEKNESVPLFLKVDDQKLVIGTLSAKKCNHIMFDLVFEKEFELSHNWSNGSVYFCGYKSHYTVESDDDSSENESDSEEEEHTPLVFEANGIPEQKDVPSKEKVKEEDTDSNDDEDEEDSEDDSEDEDEDESAEQKDVPSKPSTDNAKSKVKVVEPIKEEKVKEEDTDSDDDEDEEDSEDDSEDEDESAEDMADSSDDEDDDSSDEEDEATPKKAEQNKKRPAPPAESDTKTPTGKKAKLVTPQKIGGEGKKTGGHIATPYPSKQAGKTSANKDKSKQQSPASDGQVNCGSCSKSFKSDQARDSHSKAKHAAK